MSKLNHFLNFDWKYSMKILFLFTVIILVFPSCNSNTVKPFSSDTKDNTELRIFSENIVVGVAAGAAAGAIASKVFGMDRRLGAALGATAGGVFAYKKARKEVSNLRNHTLKNDQMNKLVSTSKNYNKRQENYNNQLRDEIKEFRKNISSLNKKNASKEKEVRLISEKLQATEKRKQAIVAKIHDRKLMINALAAGSQKKILQKEFNVLKTELRQLDQLLAELQNLNKTVRIG